MARQAFSWSTILSAMVKMCIRDRVDNEAGMEHISRGILPTMQTAILVSDCSRRDVYKRQAVNSYK